VWCEAVSLVCCGFWGAQSCELDFRLIFAFCQPGSHDYDLGVGGARFVLVNDDDAQWLQAAAEVAHLLKAR